MRKLLTSAVLSLTLLFSVVNATTAAAQNKMYSNHSQIVWAWSASGITIYNEYNTSVNVYYSATWTDGDGVTHNEDKTVNIPAKSDVLEYTGYITGATFSVNSVTNASTGNLM